MQDTAAIIIERVFDTYLDAPVDGGWHDQLSQNGDIISKAMPCSTFYHWFCAASEVHAYANEIRAEKQSAVKHG